MIPEPERRIQVSSREVCLRTLRSVKEMSQLVELQRVIWGYGQPDRDFPYPARALFAVAESGGHVAGAFVNQIAVGFSVAWMGIDPLSQKPYLHSQIMGVLEEYRDLGIGFHLKVYQRDFALQAALDLIKWTFDPMYSKNANLNVRKLGALIQTYQAHYYGEVQSHFSHGLATDRVWANWHIASQRVEQRLANPPSLLEQKPPLVQVVTPAAQDEKGRKTLLDPLLGCSERELLVEIPADFAAICEGNLSLAKDWQAKIGKIFQHYLSQGYLTADFLMVGGSPRSTFYLLTRDPLDQVLSVSSHE